jgi:hypothetical protein
MARVRVLVDPETAAAAAAAVSGRLIAPESATVKGKTKKWMQVLEISDCNAEIKTEADKDGVPDTRTSFTVKFIVPPDIDAADPNNGKPFTQWYDIREEAFHNPTHPRYKGTNFAIGRLNSLLRATGIEIPPGEMVDYGEYLSADAGERSMVVGLRVNALIREYEDNNSGQTRQTVDEYLSV